MMKYTIYWPWYTWFWIYETWLTRRRNCSATTINFPGYPTITCIVICCYRSHSTGSLPHPVYLNTCSSASPLTITHYPDPRRLNSLAHNMIFRAAPLKLYAIFVFLFVLPVVQVTDVVEVPSLVSRYIKLFLGSPSQSQQNRRSLPVKMKKSHDFQLLPCFLWQGV